MGFGEIFRMNRMRVDSALTQALRSRWDAEATAFVFPWGHMIPSLEDLSWITGLRIYGRPSLGLFDVEKGAGESEDEHLDKLVRVSRRELESEPGAQADLDLRRFLVLFLGRLLFATRGDAVHFRFLPLLEDLSEVGGYTWEAAFLTHQFDSLGASERQTSTSGFFLFLQVVWQPYLGEGDEGQPWLVQARPYFGRPGRSFRGLHDTTDWRELAKEQIDNCKHQGKAVKSDATTDDAYFQAYALKYGGKVYKSARHQVDVAGEVASLRALLYSGVQDREVAQRQTAELLERVRSTKAGSASSSRAARGSPSLLKAQLVGAVLRAEEAQRHLEERERDLRLTMEHAMDLQGQRDQLQGEVQTTRSERDQLRILAEAAEAQVTEATKELEALRVQRSPVDREELERVRAELREQEAVSRSLQQIVTDIGRSRSRSKSGASVSRATGASIGQYLAGSSNRWRNEEEERRWQGEASTQSARGGEMLPPPDRQEGSGESGGGQ
ncbi:hypothetical protein Taro_017812 [Colocasia esculenta]|uniref:Aminotransferase-like plant mobile domain-containing protein n=1 Tax=Colocasia esculenta TaxID=4460 RepID=A0A843UUD2_COLES|nr:hypothetical protein [Colocasia esculenta]